MFINQPDYSNRGREALEGLFNNLVADVREQWRSQEVKPQSPELPEPMLGEMGRVS